LTSICESRSWCIVNVKHSNDIEVGQVSVGTILLSLAALTMAVAAYLLG
jgi:hypothetical protein